MALWHVSEVEFRGPDRLWVRFADGVSGAVVVEPSFMRGVFEPLRQDAFFKQAVIEHGAVTWPGGIDLAPDAMHDNIVARGEYRVL